MCSAFYAYATRLPYFMPFSSYTTQVSPEHTEKFARLVPALVKILRKLLQADPVSEYNVGGVTDPFLQARDPGLPQFMVSRPDFSPTPSLFLQAKILYLLRVLGKGNVEASEAMNPVLAQVRL